jgi:Alpha-glutamyl/putrescinyl thymine pyrophosphorylase clade 3
MPTFCRHNRFIERCPICSRDLPDAVGASGAGAKSRAGSSARSRPGRAARPRSEGTSGSRERRGTRAGEHLRVRRQERAVSDGYSSALLPGVHSSLDARRLAQEIAFSSGRLLALAADPRDFYGELRALAASDLERASWGCFLTAYLSPLQVDPGPEAGDAEADSGDRVAPAGDPFASIRRAFAFEVPRELPDLEGLALGPRSSHERGRGDETLVAYLQWAQRSGGQAQAFLGDVGWSPERRFQRVLERLALPGFGRAGRYELLVLLGRLGLYELRADSLALAAGRGVGGEDLTDEGAKRVFAIGDALLLERRAGTLAQEAGVPVEALDLALANWAAGERASLGFPPDALDEDALARTEDALGL